MISCRMFAHALEVLTTEDRDVCKHFTLASVLLTVHLLGFNVVKVMSLKLVSTETGRGRPNRPTILPCV